MSPTTTVFVQQCLDRLRAGDDTARAELIAATADRLERLARKMLHGSFARVGRWAETGDVLQSAIARLWAALAATTPETPLHFHRLAALHLRRELIDLSRQLFGPRGVGANHASAPATPRGGSAPGPLSAAPTPDDRPDEGAEWAEFHERVQQLPADEGAVTDLLYYQGLTQEEAAALLGVDVRTVQRRWLRARRTLGEFLSAD